MLQRFVFLLCSTIGSIALAQSNSYPQNYFRNPLNIPISLAGNFGECRIGHFHSGMDIKTDGKENPEFAYVPSATIEVRPIKTKETETGFVYPRGI